MWLRTVRSVGFHLCHAPATVVICYLHHLPSTSQESYEVLVFSYLHKWRSWGFIAWHGNARVIMVLCMVWFKKLKEGPWVLWKSRDTVFLRIKGEIKMISPENLWPNSSLKSFPAGMLWFVRKIYIWSSSIILPGSQLPTPLEFPKCWEDQCIFCYVNEATLGKSLRMGAGCWWSPASD